MSDTKLRPEDLTSEERAFNKLTPTQTELLALLSEECGEVVQVIGKILRHGLESFHPNGGPTNRELLAEEIGDCLCASRLLASAGMLNMASVEDRSAAKMEKVFRYLHHARRALFAPEPEKVAKVECPNCRQPTSSVTEHIFDEMKPGCVRTAYTCKGPQPEPEKVAKVSAFPVGNCVVCGELVAPYNKHAKYEGGYTCQRPQPAPPEPAKVECPNCGEMTSESHADGILFGAVNYTCQPAPPEPAAHEDAEFLQAGALAMARIIERDEQPEPAAPEMPEALHLAWILLDVAGQEDSENGRAHRRAAVALRDWWRNLAQPKGGSDELLRR